MSIPSWRRVRTVSEWLEILKRVIVMTEFEKATNEVKQQAVADFKNIESANIKWTQEHDNIRPF